MSAKVRMIRALIRWLDREYPYLMREAILKDDYHLHRNPRKKLSVVGGNHANIQFPTREEHIEATAGVDKMAWTKGASNV